MGSDVIDTLHLRLRRVDVILAKVGNVIETVSGSAKTIALQRRSFLRNTRYDIVLSIGVVARGMRLQGETVH